MHKWVTEEWHIFYTRVQHDSFDVIYLPGFYAVKTKHIWTEIGKCHNIVLVFFLSHFIFKYRHLKREHFWSVKMSVLSMKKVINIENVSNHKLTPGVGTCSSRWSADLQNISSGFPWGSDRSLNLETWLQCSPRRWCWCPRQSPWLG